MCRLTRLGCERVARDARCGDDRPEQACTLSGASRSRRSRTEGVAQHGAQGSAIGSDLFRVPAVSAARGLSWGCGTPILTGSCRVTGRSPARERPTLIRIFEELRGLGYEGSYDAVRRYAEIGVSGAATAEAYVPLSLAPGEACQFDWSHEVVLINGTTVTVKITHVRLCHSRMLFVRGLSAPDPGNGVRRAQPRFRLLSRGTWARHSTTT